MRRYTVPDEPKMLRESLCVAQTQIGQSDDLRKAEHIARLGRLIEECDRHLRHLGPDCQHKDLEKRPSRLGDMRYNPETGQVEAPVLEFAWVCTACGKELE